MISVSESARSASNATCKLSSLFESQCASICSTSPRTSCFEATSAGITTIVGQSCGKPSVKSSLGKLLGGTIMVANRCTKDMEITQAGINITSNDPAKSSVLA